jgi:segregation and condensation protein A
MTLSGEEAKELSAEALPVSREAAQHVLDYLLWNKALIGENLVASQRLENYMDLVRNLKEGVHVVIQDPYERATAMLFELVMSEEFNPWSIDLVRFTQLYLERVKVNGMDFPVAGRLIYMAWNILYLQSQVILDSRKEPIVPDGQPFDQPLDDGYLGEMGTTEELDATTAILSSPDPPFEAMVRHAESRPVSLLELTKAFGEAEKEARLALDAQRARDRLREEQSKSHDVFVHGEEVPLRDLESAWNVALGHPIGERFPFDDVLNKEQSRERIVSLFLSVLFLVWEGGVELHQEAVGKGAIFIVRVAENRDASRMLISKPVPPVVAVANS